MAARKASHLGKWRSIVACLTLASAVFLPAVHADDDKKPPQANPAADADQPLTDRQKQLLVSVQRGVIFLKATQNQAGNWGNGQHPVGYAALPALAMLEVGLPANDVSIQNAASFVRTMVPTLDKTYELSLAILFLNKLGERKDVPLIQIMALRLMAGQTLNGGWAYDCPILNSQEEQQLALWCKNNQPRLNPATKDIVHPYLVVLPKSQESLVDPQIRKEREDEPLKNPLIDPLALPLPNLLSKDSPKKTDPSEPKPAQSVGEKLPDAPPSDKKPDAKKGKETDSKKPATNAKDPFLAIHQWPSVPRYVGQTLRPSIGVGPKIDDNSNTQFAILALWASRKHRVPVGMTLVQLDQRFRTSQVSDGGWSYHVNLYNLPQISGETRKYSTVTPWMTCVGLLGLGLAHGSFEEAAVAQKKDPTPANFVYDPAIQKGLACLGKSVGPGRTKMEKGNLNLYYLWSLERVAVMYHLPTVGGVDWHAWGTDLILPRQQANGSWNEKGYLSATDISDTSMALFFLSRANFNRDLSESLRRYIVVVDPVRANP